MSTVLFVYAIGTLIGIFRTDGGIVTRLALGLLWPIGPAAFLVTFSILLAASLIAFPLIGAIAAVAAAIVWIAIR